jgi:hypothetical protein
MDQETVSSLIIFSIAGVMTGISLAVVLGTIKACRQARIRRQFLLMSAGLVELHARCGMDEIISTMVEAGFAHELLDEEDGYSRHLFTKAGVTLRFEVQ